MANPDVQSLPQWTWVKVASSVTYGKVNNLSPGYDFYQTYRDTGEAAPTALVAETKPDEAVKIFEDFPLQEPIGAPADKPIDVYIFCYSRDGKITDNGELRVDL